MSLSAKYKHEIYYAPDLSDEAGQANEFYCIACEGRMVYHRNLAGIRIQHFAHKVECPFETEPETREHIAMKKWCYENIPADKMYKPDSKVVGGQKPDILVEVRGVPVAIECQCSKIGFSEWSSRTANYNYKGIYVLWLFGGEYIYHKEGDYGECYTSEVEREAAKLYFGRVYYAEQIGENFSIVPKRLRMAHWWKIKRFIERGRPITNHSLLLTKSSNEDGEALVARFYDKKWWD